jgi:hypothetical protein
MKHLGMAVRLLLTAALIVIVWKHSHWSVALTLTLLAITSEIRDFTTQLATRTLRRLVNPTPREMEQAIGQTVGKTLGIK